MDKQTVLKPQISWITIIMQLLIGSFLCIVTFIFARAGTSLDDSKKELDNKANITFVIDQDNVIKERLKSHEENDDKRWSMLFRELDDIKTYVKNNNK